MRGFDWVESDRSCKQDVADMEGGSSASPGPCECDGAMDGWLDRGANRSR